MPTARFRSVVAKAGRPQTHLQFVAPEKDAELQAALRKNRVMSITRTVVGQGKDFGVVGYEGGAVSQLLLFPKSLEKFKNYRIVGVDYSLLDEPVATSGGKPKPKAVQSPLKLTSPAAQTAPLFDKPLRAGLPSPPKKAAPAQPRKKNAKTVKSRAIPQKRKATALQNLKSMLSKVLWEWDKGNDVKANRMLTKIVNGL